MYFIERHWELEQGWGCKQDITTSLLSHPESIPLQSTILLLKCIYKALFQKTDQSAVQYYSTKIHTSKNTKQILKAI